MPRSARSYCRGSRDAVGILADAHPDMPQSAHAKTCDRGECGLVLGLLMSCSRLRLSMRPDDRSGPHQQGQHEARRSAAPGCAEETSYDGSGRAHREHPDEQQPEGVATPPQVTKPLSE